MISANLTCGCGRGPTPGTRAGFVRNASAVAAAHQFRGKKRERKKIDRGRHSPSVSPALFPAFLFRLVPRVLLSPRTARARNRVRWTSPCARNAPSAPSTLSSGGKIPHNSYPHPATCLETTQHPSTLSSAVDGKLTTVVTVM